MDDWVKTLLYLSVYQLEFLDKVPAHAILNEAVEIAKVKGNPGTGKFVNGVLRNYQRQGAPDLQKALLILSKDFLSKSACLYG